MDVRTQVQEMDAMVSQGDIVNAVKAFFADAAATSDYAGLTTTGKQDMVTKMEGFVGSIEKVNSIVHHRTIVDGNASASEFTFDFDMKDNSKVHWHEVIRRIWDGDGKVIREEYFNAA